MSSSNEAVREREVLKYDGDYVSRSIINIRYAKHTNPEIEARWRESSPLPAVLSTATDSTLTSLAQLAAFRLNCKRALISLYDRNFQYIVAEATQSLPLQPGVTHPDLWLCGTGIPRSHGICEHVLIAPQGETLPVSVVPDLAEDGRFCDRHYIHNAPFNRFYAGVPIRSHKGINIGVLCVFDEKPHVGLDGDLIQFLQDLSRNIMAYLEARRVRDATTRHEKMVRGLGSFVEGDSEISGLDRKQNGQANAPIIASDLVDSEECGALYVRQEELKLRLAEHEAEQLVRPCRVEAARAMTESLIEVAEKPVRPVDPASVRSTSDSQLHQHPATLPPSPNVADAHGPSHFSEVKQVFAKAANIIRQSIDVDGVVFLDASIRSFGGLVDMNGVGAEAPLDSLSAASSGDESMVNAILDTERPYGSPFCSVLGFSTTQQSSLNNDIPEPGYSLVKERFLRALLRRFPKGQIMNFDSDGLILPGDSSSSEDETAAGSNLGNSVLSSSACHTTRAQPLQTWATQAGSLLKIFPGIRSLAILPVWDASRERWYAGGFVFTRSSSRIFTSEVELGFLRTFGKAIQTELIQVETTFSEKTKSDALGSLSHELRSPLHGLLGACELLHDTRMSAFQRDMVRMAETSGRTLLDVIDHLLDYSKMSSIRGYPEQSPSSSSRKSGQNLGFFDSKIQYLTAVDVDLIVEEVVESVSTGHSFQKIAAADVPRKQSSGSLSTTTLSPTSAEFPTLSQTSKGATEAGQVSVYLDIDNGHSWHLMAYPGAIRRIVMDLLGNSLKFTSDGFIFVSLKQELPTRSKRGVDIVLTIIDSGRGISEDFLQHQLFKPFSQEDKLSPGTGLGLNVVKQIVNMLSGNITVLSQPGLGTKTVVSIPLAHASEPKLSADPFSSNVSILKGQSVHLTGFDNVLHTHFLASRRMEEKTLLSRLCQDWFGMTMTKAQDWEAGETPNVLIADETSLEQIDALQLRGKMACPILVVCHNSITAHDISARTEISSYGSNLHFITQPIGPRKLAQALISSIEQYQRHVQTMRATTEQDLLTPEAAMETAQTGMLEIGISSDVTPTTEAGTISTTSSRDEQSASPASTYSDEAEPASIQALPQPAVSFQANVAEVEVTTTELAARLKEIDIKQSENGANSVEQTTAELNFLVVDDNKINVQILSSFLKRLKKPHSTAMDGFEALETYRCSPNHFDYVFMDISMPRMDGLEATRRIRMFEREQGDRKPAKIIALTGLVSEDIQKEAFASGIDLFLTKPVKLQQLKDLINQHNITAAK